MKLVLLAKIKALVLENHSNAATSLLFTPVMPTMCSGTLCTSLMELVGPIKHVGVQINVSEHLVWLVPWPLTLSVS